MRMNLTKVFFYTLLSLISYYSKSQNLSGEWNGYLSQDDKTWKFTMSVWIDQEGSTLTGTARYGATAGIYVKHAFTGYVDKNEIHIKETKVIEENSGGQWEWCIKLMDGSIKTTANSVILEGDWKNDGLRGFSRGVHVNNMNRCAPGTFRLERKFTCSEQIARNLFVSVSDWRVKGRYESTKDWVARTTEQNIENKYKQLLQQESASLLSNSIFTFDYDADEELFTVHSSCFSDFFFRVPRSEAECFEKNFSYRNITKSLFRFDTTRNVIELQSITAKSSCNNKLYSYPLPKNNPEVVAPSEQVTVPKRENIPPTIRNREVKIIKTLEVSDPTVTVKFYDNAEIDNDSISVYFNNQLVKSKQLLGTKPLTLTLKIDPGKDNVITMFAENLGSIPPNTALMVVEYDNTQLKLNLESTFSQSNALRIVAKSPGSR
jgi:hypothetical protein